MRIVVRGDSGFCREHLMAGARTTASITCSVWPRTSVAGDPGAGLGQARQLFEQSGQASRVFKDFRYSTLDSWSRERRVVGKAEHLAKGPNPRFVVTSLAADEAAAQPLYERDYCHRGEMENRIKEQQRMLFANRVSCRRCGPTNCVCSSGDRRTSCFGRCVSSVWSGRSWRRHNATRSG